MNSDHSFVVVGCGGLGSAALFWLSRAASPYASVVGLGHEHGGDHSRIVRRVQHRDAGADLAPAAYASWRQVEALSGQQLITETGGLVIEDVAARRDADAGSRTVERYLEVAARHGVEVDLLDAAALTARWPQFRLRGTERAVYQRHSGIVDARRAIATHLALARGHGAEIRDNSPVRAVHDAGRHVEVVTDDEVYRAEHVVVTADNRTDDVLDGLLERAGHPALPRTVTQEQVTCYATPNLVDFSPGRFPVFQWHGADDVFGFPVHGEVATKVGRHSAGHEFPADHRERLAEFLAEYLPGFGGPELDTRTCEHTIPPDEGFALGTVPGCPRVSVAVGAGHAFTFASLIGRVLAELAMTGTTRHPIDAFALDRPALIDPSTPRSLPI